MKKYKTINMSTLPVLSATWFYDFLCRPEETIINGPIYFLHYMAVFFPIYVENRQYHKNIVCIVIKDNSHKIINK